MRAFRDLAFGLAVPWPLVPCLRASRETVEANAICCSSWSRPKGMVTYVGRVAGGLDLDFGFGLAFAFALLFGRPFDFALAFACGNPPS